MDENGVSSLPCLGSTCRKTSKNLGLHSIDSARKGEPGKQSDAQHPTFETLQHCLCLLMTVGKRCKVPGLKEAERALPSSAGRPAAASPFCLRGEHKQVQLRTHSRGIDTAHGKYNLNTARQWGSLSESSHPVSK